jgi:hypothetical protein
MKISTVVALSTVAVLTASLAWAGDEKDERQKIPAHSKEWTDHNSSDPGVKSTMDELASIVVLCAADHQSDEFKQAWSAYVNKHKPDRAEVSRLISEVLAGAQKRKPEVERSKNWKGEATIIMHETSSARLRKAGERS